MTETTQLDATFAALAHPTRRAILAQLIKGTATVNELAQPFDSSLPAISQHIRVLENAGLIERHKDAQFRHCKLNPEPLAQISKWTDQYRDIWNARFDALSNTLNTLKDNQDD